jgi:hypothetical protein
MQNKKRKPRKRQKRVIIYSPGLWHILNYEAEHYATRGGKPLPPPLRRHLPLLVSAVLDPKKLLIRDQPTENARRMFSKTYGRNPKAFLDLMLHLTRYYSKLCHRPIARALRENWIITFRDRGVEIKKPINQATREELAYFIRTRYGLSKLKAKTVARCKERLAKADSKLPADERLVRNALRIFTEQIHPKSLTIPVPDD